MIADFEFYRVPEVSYTQRIHPIFNTGYDTSWFMKKKFENVKTTEDLTMTRSFPYFDGYSECNMVRIVNSSFERWYWIMGFHATTLKDGQISFDLEMCPITTGLAYGDSLRGFWQKTPTRVTKHLTNDTTSDAMAFSRKARFTFDPEGGIHNITRTKNSVTEKFGVCWVQITALTPSCPLLPDQADGEVDLENVDQSSYNTYGALCLYYKDRLDLCREKWPLPRKTSVFDGTTYLGNEGELIWGGKDYSYLCYDDAKAFNARPAWDNWTDLGGGNLLYFGYHGVDDLFRTGKVFPWSYIYRKWMNDGRPADTVWPHIVATPSRALPCLPSLDEVINNPDTALGIPASLIKDISISTRCPYRVAFIEPPNGYTDADGYVWSGFPVLLPDDPDCPITVPYDNTVTADDKEKYKFELKATNVNDNGDDVPSLPNDLLYYSLVDSGAQKIARRADVWNDYGWYISDAEHDMGLFEIRDERGTVMATIPTEYFDATNDPLHPYVLKMKWKCWNDTMGIYTSIVPVKTVGNTEVELSAPIQLVEGKLPFVGDAWYEYRAYSMAQDRENLQLAKMDALSQGLSNTAMGLAFGAASGIGSSLYPQSITARNFVDQMNARRAGKVDRAVSLGGMATGNIVSTLLSMYSADKQQEITEKYMKQGPGTGYMDSYGYIYLSDSVLMGAGVYLQMPANYSETKHEEYLRRFGYNSEGYSILTVDTGYYEGMIIRFPSPITDPDTAGLLGEAIRQEFAKGVYIYVFQPPTPDPDPEPTPDPDPDPEPDPEPGTETPIEIIGE